MTGSSKRRRDAAYRLGFEAGRMEMQDPALSDVARVIKESGGWWHSCSGCYDTEDGHPTAPYPHSPALGCDVGSGCHECGGLGAVWEYYSPEQLAEMQKDGAAA